MRTLIDIQTLKIFITDTALYQGRPLHEVIIETARQQSMANVVAYRGCAGFGANNLLQAVDLLHLTSEQPLVIEIVDIPSRIKTLFLLLRDLVPEGTLVIQAGQAFFRLPVPITEIMTAPVATVDLDAPLHDVVSLLLHREIKAVPVMNENRILGIITGGDLLSRAQMPLRLDMHGHLPTILRAEHVHSQKFDALKAKDIMTSPAMTLNMRATLDDALATMTSKHVKRLPILTNDGILMGIVSRTDILEAIGQTVTVADHLNVLPPGIKSTAQEILYTNVPVAGPEEPLSSIIKMMVGSFLRLVVIIDAQKTILGIIHDWDILLRAVENNSPAVVTRLIAALTQREKSDDFLDGIASEVMQPLQVTAGLEATLAELIHILVEHKMKRLVITDNQNRLQGVVDRDMILQRLAVP